MRMLLTLSGMRPAKGWTVAAATAVAVVPGAEAATELKIEMDVASAVVLAITMIAIALTMVVLHGCWAAPAQRQQRRAMQEAATQTEGLGEKLSGAVFSHPAWFDLLDLASVAALRNECSQRGLPRSGLKVDLRKRLVENAGGRPTERQARYLLGVLRDKINEP
eukprot:9330892-Lingulodinium_polyedra.AAC.1